MDIPVMFNVKDARRQLKALLDRVEAGEEIPIARRGRVIARLVPPSQTQKRPSSLKNFRASVQVKGVPLSEVVRQEREKGR